MKIIFWNSKHHVDFSTVREILVDEQPDILFLAETDLSVISSNTTNLNNEGFEYFDNPGCDRIIIIKKISRALSLGRQDSYYSALRDVSTNIMILSIHFPSQMNQHFDALKSKLRRFRGEIDSTIGNSLTNDILVIGDFNVSPYETPMIAHDGFSASNTRKMRKSITSLGDKKDLYYNPTWTLYSRNNFPGTIKYKRPSTTSFDILEHHFLDQVVVSYSLSRKLVTERVRILENTTSKVFFNTTSNSVQISDHLPLVYEFSI